MTLLVAVAATAMAGCGKKKPIVLSVDPTFITSVHSDLNTIGTAIVLYSQDNSHVLPQFDSANMPTWWSRYGGGRTLTPGVSYTIAPGLPGTKIDKLNASSDFIIAKSKDLISAGGQSNTIVMSFDNTFVYR